MTVTLLKQHITHFCDVYFCTMKFLYHFKLGRIWFLVWFIGISVYLITTAIRRYIAFKTLQFDIVFEREIDGVVMSFYLTCIILSIVLSILCLYCTVYQTGNYANDCSQFGEGILDFKLLKMDLQRQLVSRHITNNNSCFKPKFWKRIRCHFPPYYLMLYFFMSLTLLISLPYLESEKIKNELSGSSSPRHTNLDIIFNANGDEKMFYNTPNSYIQSTSFEFFNLCISLVLYTFSYSHVFWKYNKMFTILFSLVTFLSGIVFILDMSLVEMLVKISRLPDHNNIIFTPFLISILSILGYVMMIVHQIALFEYGYIRLTEALLPRYSTESMESCPTYNAGVAISVQFISVCKQLCIESWSGVLLPCVIGIFSVVLSVCIRLAYICKGMTNIYSHTKDSLVLANLVVAILFVILTMILWVSLLLKSRWPLQFTESAIEFNGDCAQYINRHPHSVPALPIYASVNRHPMSSPPLGQEPNFPIFCDPGNSQWRYSCSPPSCGPNDSNSDRTTSCKNGDIGISLGNNSKNYIIMRRGNPVSSIDDSPNIGRGIYSQLIKLTPQTSLIENNNPDNVATNHILANDISESSSNQTVHIINPVSLDFSRGTLDRSSTRVRTMTSSEYFNILNFVPHPPATNSDVYDHTASMNADTESTNLCSQV